MSDLAARRETLAIHLVAVRSMDGDQVRRLIGDHDVLRVLDFYWFARKKASVSLSDMGRQAVVELQRERAVASNGGGQPKTCSKCGKEKPRGEFPVALAKGRFYVRSWCKACLGDYYRANSERRRRLKACAK